MEITVLSLWILFNICLNVESKSVEYKSERELTREILSQGNETKFNDLTSDVLYPISDELKVADLLEMVRSNSKLACLADDQFYRKYKQYNIAIMVPGPLLTGGNRIIECAKSSSVEIFDLQLAAELLKNMGHVIRKLRIQNHEIFIAHAKIVNQYMEKHGSKCLTHLNLDSIEDTFERLTIPFENVIELTFSVKTMNVRGGVQPLSRLFPRLERLKMELHSNVDYSFIDYSFPSLEDVHIVIHTVKERLSQVESFLGKNQQIRGIHIVSFVPDFVRNLSRILPNVERLTLESSHIKGNTIVQFDRVTHFKLYEQFPTSLEKLRLPQLDWLEMQFSEESLDDWVAFLKQHKNISRLSVTQVDTEMQLVKLTTVLENLAEITLECSTYITVDEIIEFFDSHEKLRIFTLSMFGGFNEADVSVLGERFGDDWHIHLNDDNSPWITILLERK